MSEFGLKIQVYKFFDVIQKRKRTMEWYIYALLFVIAMVTVHLVSWVGNVLHSVPNGGQVDMQYITVLMMNESLSRCV